MTRVTPRRGLRGGEGSGGWVSGSDHPRGGAAGAKVLGCVWHGRSGEVSNASGGQRCGSQGTGA